jgi:hypothetical protein
VDIIRRYGEEGGAGLKTPWLLLKPGGFMKRMAMTTHVRVRTWASPVKDGEGGDSASQAS